jgi:hypothetical protein
MTFPRQISLLAFMAFLGLALSGCQPSDPDSPRIVQLRSIAVTPNPVNLEIGGVASLVVTGTLEDQSTYVVNFGTTFASSATGVASVTPDTGYITAISAGSATITATHTDSGLTSTTTVVVSPLRVISIDVAPATSTLAVGSTQSLVVTATYNNGTSGNVNADSTFVSSNPTVATVGASGVVSAIALGDAVITVTHTPSGKTDTATVTVGNGGGGAAPLISFDEVPPPRLTDFGTNGPGAVIASDPAGGVNKVLQVFKYALPVPGSEQWAGTTISTIFSADPADAGSIPAIPFSDSAKTMTVRVWSPAVSVRVRLKVEDASNPGISVETDAITTKSGEWETLTFDFANPGLSPPVGGGPTSPLDLTKTYNRLSIFMDFGVGNGGSGPLPADRVYYVDDIVFVGGGGGGTAPTDAPATVIPAGSVTIYSDAVVTAAFDPFPNWGQNPPVTSSEVTIAGNKSLQYVWAGPGGLYQGLDWSSSPVDVSGKAKLHIDFWTPDVTSVKVSIISPGPVENAYTQVLTTGGWNSVDIDLSNYNADKSAIIQIKLEPATPGTLYVDNIYFWGTSGGSGSCGTTEPDCAPTTVIPAGSTTIYSDAVVTAAFDPFPNWGQNPPVTSSEVTIASNKSLKYVWAGPGGLYQGLDWASSPVDVSGKAKLHIDFWTPDVTSVKVSIISPGPVENAYTQVLTSGSWNSVDIDLSNFIANKASIIQIKLEPATPGTLYVDNIYFWGTSGGGGGGALVFASNYSQVNSSSWTSDEGGAAGKYIDDSVTTLQWWDGVARADTTPSFYFGYGINVSAKPWGFGAFVKAPGNGTADITGKTDLKIAVWGNDELVNTGPTLTLLLIGPAVSGCSPVLASSVSVAAAGVQNYTAALSSFTLQTACGYASAAAALAAGVNEVHVQVLGANVQYVSSGDPDGNYPNGLNVGPISFN